MARWRGKDKDPAASVPTEGDEVQSSIELLDNVLSEFDDLEAGSEEVGVDAPVEGDTPDDESSSRASIGGHQSEDDGYMSMNGRRNKFVLSFRTVEDEGPTLELPPPPEPPPTPASSEMADFPPPPEEAERIISTLIPRVSPVAAKSGNSRRIFSSMSLANDDPLVADFRAVSAGTQTTLPMTRHQRPYGWESSSTSPPPREPPRFGSLPCAAASRCLPPRTVAAAVGRHREVRRAPPDEENFSDDSLEELPVPAAKRNSIAWEVPLGLDDVDPLYTPGSTKVIGRRRRRSGEHSSSGSLHRLRDDESITPTGTYVIRKGRKKERKPVLSSPECYQQLIHVTPSSDCHQQLDNDQTDHKLSLEIIPQCYQTSVELKSPQDNEQQCYQPSPEVVPECRIELKLSPEVAPPCPERKTSLRELGDRRPVETLPHLSIEDQEASAEISPINHKSSSNHTSASGCYFHELEPSSESCHQFGEQLSPEMTPLSYQQHLKRYSSTFDNIKSLLKDGLLEGLDEAPPDFPPPIPPTLVRVVSLPALPTRHLRPQDLAITLEEDELIINHDILCNHQMDDLRSSDEESKLIKQLAKNSSQTLLNASSDSLLLCGADLCDKLVLNTWKHVEVVEVVPPEFPPLPPSPVEEDYDEYVDVMHRSPMVRLPAPLPSHDLKTRSMDAEYSRASRNRDIPSDRRTLPSELSGPPRRRTYQKRSQETSLQTSCSLPETPIFARGCDIPRTPHRRAPDIPRRVPGHSASLGPGHMTPGLSPGMGPGHSASLGPGHLSTSVSQHGPGHSCSLGPGQHGPAHSASMGPGLGQALAGAELLRLAGGPGRGWYPRHRQNARPASIEHLDRLPHSGTFEARKPFTLPPNMAPSMAPPKFFHRSPREALRRVTSLLVRSRGNNSKDGKKESLSPTGGPSFGEPSGEVTRQKRGFFKNFWKKSRHYSLEHQ